MYGGTRQFSRGNGAGLGTAPNRNRRFRGQYTRTRSPQQEHDEPAYQAGNNNNSHHQQHQQQQHQQQQHQQHNNQNHRRNDFEEIKDICSKLSVELDLVKSRINEVALNVERMMSMSGGKKPKGSKRQDALADQPKEPRPKKSLAKDRENDSTTQAADPSSEDKLDGEDGAERVKKVYKRKRNLNNRRGYRRRMDSSDRNSNDTSPQNGEDYRRQRQRKVYPQLSESEMNEVVQAVKRDFFASEIPAVIKAIGEKGPALAKEFAYAILDHAIQDVINIAKLSDIAGNMAQIIISDDGGREFQAGLSSALNDISKRGEEIVIDAPRYMDTLGQVLGNCLIAMHDGRGKKQIRRFATKVLHAFMPTSRAALLASVMRGIADTRDERLAKVIWGIAGYKWSTVLKDPQVDVEEFLATEKVQFTARPLTPEPQKPKRPAGSLDKFADDVTDLVEKGCALETLEEAVRDLGLEPDEKTEYLGTLVYAIVRACLATADGESRLDNESLNKYSDIIKSVQSDSISLHALTALTKLWHTLNCPQNLMSNILLALHNLGAASCETLQTWLNSEDLKNIPGIGAARLNSKRCIEDLCATRN